MPYDKIDQLYDALYADGAVSKDREYFRGQMLAPGEQGYKNRKQLYDALKADGAVESPTYEDFAAGLGLHAVKPERRNIPQQPAIDDFKQTINDANQTIGQSQQAVRRIGNRQQRIGLDLPQGDFGRINLGQNRKVTKGQKRLNPDTGELEDTYVTPQGNEYENREMADIEQNVVDDAERRELDPIGTQLSDAYAEQDRLYQMANDRRKQLEQEGKGEGFFSRFLREAGRAAQSDKLPDNVSPSKDLENDSEYSAIMSAIRKNNELITTLEDQRDHQTNEFWHSFGTELANGYTFSLGGKSRMDDIIALTDAKKHIDSINKKRANGESLTHEEEVAEAVLKNNELDREVQAKYGDEYGAWARAGKMGANSADFMVDFLMMGGAPASLARGIMNQVVKGGGKLLGNLATKGFGNFMLKTTGATLGSMVAGAEITNTIQLGKTASDVAQSMTGDVYLDKNGNYTFGHYEEDENGNPKFVKGGNDFFTALAEAQRNGISENGSEILGTFLPGANKVFESIGLSKIARGLTALKGKNWYKNYSKFLQTAGFNGTVGEGLEEYGGMALDFMMGGDEWKKLGEGRTHVDIWLGVTTMSGMLNAPNLIGTGYSAVQYQRYKKAVNQADVAASSTMNPEEWSALRETIDGTDNVNMPDVAMSILNDNDLTPESKRAAMDYIGNLQKMRGFSLGSIAADKTQSEDEASSNDSRAIDEGYTEGYDTQTPDDMKIFVDEAEAARDNLSRYGEEFAKMVSQSLDPVGTLNELMSTDDGRLYSDNEIAAAADFYQKRARAQGVMDAAMDRIDLEVEKANAEVRGNMHQQTGQVITAQSGDGAYYIIGGDVAMDEETGMPVVAGTGGAVVVKDALTGEVSVKSPQDIVVTSMQNADDMFRYNEEVLRQQLEQQTDEDITYGSPANEVYDFEDQVTLNDGEGGIIDGTVVMLPNAVDGVFVVETNDGRALQMTADELNRRIVMHNGMEVQRGNQGNEQILAESEQNQAVSAQNPTLNAQNPQNYAQNQPQNIPEVSGNTPRVNENTPKETEITPEEKPQSALDRIPIRTDSQGNPVKNKNGRPVLDWHKASVEDAAAALIETTGGDMVMARDTASDLVRNEQARLDKIRKQKPKGDDPIEIAESRVAIRKQEQEQQAIIKQWQDVNQLIQKQMRDEQNRLAAEREAAKSEEQKAREAEEARIRQEQQDEQDRQRLREQIERDKVKRNREYEPLVKAREDLADDQEALDILNDTEPRDLEEWVSSLLRPHSMLWQDASDAEVGLQSELGLKRADMQRMMSLLGTKESGAKPFGKVVLDIYEGLSDAMKQQYTDEDVRQTLLNLFNEGSSARMLNLTQEHRIEEAREMAKENARRDAEAEMDAWAEAYHLTPEERETYNEWMQMPPTEPEQEIINQIIVDNEQDRTSQRLGEQPDSGEDEGTIEAGGNVQGSVEAANYGNHAEGTTQGEETVAGESPAADDALSGSHEEYVEAAIPNPDVAQPIGKTSSPEEIAAEEAKVDTNPTDGQKEAGNYQKGHINVDGYDITIENPKGSVRSGVDSKGNRWETTMRNTYGYIRGTEGVDGDHIDVFLSDNPTSGSVFVVDQVNPETGQFDEHKVMYGFASEEEARQAYLSNYAEGWQGLGAITEVSREEFKKWVESSHRKTKPFHNYKRVNTAGTEILAKGGSVLYSKNGGIIKVVGSNIDKNTGERYYTCIVYENEEALKGGNDVNAIKFRIDQKDMRNNLDNGTYQKQRPQSQEPAKAKPEKQHKRLVSDDKMAELRKRLLDKMNNLNEGLDMERMLIGAAYAVGKIERGVTKFADFCADMIEDLGDAIRPYLKLFYNGARDLPEAAELRPLMDDAQTVDAFDVYNFDKKKQPTAIEKAEQVVEERKVRQQAKKIKAEQPELFAGDLFGTQQEPLNEKQEPSTAQQEPLNKPAKENKTLGSAWWSDSNRPESIDPKDYKTYMTDEAKNYFANFVSEDGKTDFTKWAHPNLAYITAAIWDEVQIPYEDLKDIPEIVEAENTIKKAEAKGKLEISDEEANRLAQRLVDMSQARQERKALVIIGLPAGGKSSVFANPLAKEYGARIIDSDDVKPWLDGFDGGNGAGFVHDASAEVAERAIDISVKNGDNIIIPRIGGQSVMDLSAALRLAGYDVQLYFNDVKGVTSIDRAASRFAQTGRYLSLDYLTKKAGVPSDNFSKFAEKSIGGFLDERDQKEVQDIRGRLQRLRGELYESGSGLWESLAAGREGAGETESTVPADLGGGEQQAGGNGVSLLLAEPLFNYAEWKSNDVRRGEKPKEIWNSESGKPMPGKENKSNNNNDELHSVRSGQRVSAEPSQVGEGAEQTGGPADRAGAERSPEQDRTERSGRERSVEKPKPKHNNRRNNVGERGKDYAPTSPKARFNANVEAIKLMRVLMDEGIDAPTQDQMEVLRQYSGWGGLGTFFNDDRLAENRILRDLLTEEEYNDAVMSINSAYFTPATVIDTLWDIAEAMGFDGGNVLEGSAGIGNIIGQMPKKLSSRSDIEAVEIDKISGNILKLLYPDAKVHIAGFQDVKIPNGSVDLAITNVPFVTGLHVFDEVDKDLSRKFKNIHDFCIAKNIRKLREGGIGLFITSAGTLDKSTDLRSWITDEGQADVVGAFRLNNETFGGTNVTSDIIVVRKRVNGEKSDSAIDVKQASPIRVGSYTDKFEKEHQTSMTVNDYFHDHPEMMAGEMFFGYEKGDTFRPGSYGLYSVEGKNQEKMMQDFVKHMKKVGTTVGTTVGTRQETIEPNQLTAVKEGRMLIDDNGRLCVSRYGTAVPLGLNDQKVKGFTKQQCFEDYQAVQKAVDDVLQQQLNDPDDAHLEPKLKALNAAYDKFVKRYGTLHKNTSIAFLRNDIDFPSFQALENYSETKDMSGKVKVTTKKTPLFTQRVLGFKTEPQPKTVKDAVIASIFRSNGIDLEWIANKLSEVAAPPNGENWTTDDVRKGILVSRLGFEDPATGQIEIRYKYLSGNVREKLAMAEAYNTDGKYSANVEELRKVVPMNIPAHLIDFSLGSSWIPVELYKQYLEENYDLSNIRLNHVEGNWVLDEGYGYRNEKNRVAGVYSEQFRETIYGHQLVAAALNNRPYKVSKQVSEGWGSSKTTKTVVDKNATQACAVRVDEIKDEFKQWAKKKMQDDPELGARIEKMYNEKFNALVPMEVGDEFLPEHFEGSNTNIMLRPHQKRGVIRDLSAPTMLAHEVGTGKSFTLITTAMEMRRLGTARKPMIVVQNATVAQMTSDVKLLYPNAKVLSLTERDRDAEGRRAFYAKIKYNDWDVIIIPQSTFERIPDSPERELQFIQEKIDEKKHVIEAAMQSGMDSREIQRLQKELDKLQDEYGDKYLDSDPANNSTPKKGKKKDAKKEAAALDKAKTKAQEQLDRATDDVQYFDDLGVDALLIDEAHEYKHLGFQTSIGRGIKGIDPSYSKKCAGLYNKTRSVFEKAGWKNVVFATGTPISNTAAEIWTFMKYLMPADVMRANDIYYFDDFVHNFGAISQMLEFSTSGKFKENTRFAAYVNKPELIRIWSQVADTVLTKDAKGVKDKLPQKEGGKDQDVFLPQSPSLISIMTAVRAELERFENMSGTEKKENSSIPLTMYGIAKRAAIDPRLVNADAPDEPLSKTNAAVKEIVKDLKETSKYKGTVAVFCDNQNRKGPDGSIEFNIYEDMKKKLIEAGVPESQIAIIKSGMSITAKQKVFDAVNDGSIRVVLGSTQTLGTGVNMQERLHLLIHMDAPDRPMDYTQRNGRIERQGNLHKEWDKPIRIVRFGVEDSLDVTAYQRLKTKSGFINSIMDGKAALANNQVDRTVEEEEEGLFDNPVAVLSGSQYALKKNQAERELRKYQGKKAQWEADQVYVTNQLRRNKSEVEATEANIKTEEEQLANIRNLFPDGKVKTITVEGVPIDMTKDDGDKKLNEAIKEKINEPVNAIVKRNRENAMYNDETLHYTIKLDGHDVNFTVQVMRESVYDQGRMRTVIHKYISYTSPDLRIESTAGSNSVRENLEEILDEVVTGRDYEDRIDAYKAKIGRINAETEQLQQRVGMEFQFDKELEQARKNVEEYTELMKKEMEEKEAKYAAQQKEAKENGGFDLSKAEDSEEDDDVRYRDDSLWDDEQHMFRGVDEFAEGQQFPIRRVAADSSYNVLGRSYQYSSDLLPDEFATPQALLDAVRNAYPNYYAAIEADSIVLRSWDTVMAEARNARTVKDVKGTESYVERKTRQAIDAVTDMANRMHLDVEVLTTTDGLQGKKARSKGWFNPKTHKIVIVLPNHTNKTDVINTLLHEGVAHYGLRKMFGQNFDTFLDNVYNNVSPEIKARIDAAMKRNGWSRHEATEEYLARLAERTDFERATMSGWWQKIKDFFLEMLSKAGFNTILTDNELRYILWRSYDHLLHPDGRRNVFDTAKDIQMQSRLKVGDYAEQIRIQRTGRVDTSPMVAADELLDRTDYASEEINDIVEKAKADGTYMQAPNGKPTNLNELQWAQVRTQAFKNWFGDWENDPENASKVVDENGEPKVMYHGTNLDAVNNGEPFWTFYTNQHFGTKEQAKDRMDGKGKLYEVFLNIRNPQRRSDADQDYLEEKDMTMSEFWEQSVERAKGKGHDGIVYLNQYEDLENPADSWIAFDPNQIKSATDNSGDFSTEDNDIRYSDPDAWADDVAQEVYEKAVAQEGIKMKEAWQDSMVALKLIQNAIARETGKVATGAEDAYRFENRMHGRAKNMTEQYDWKYYRPMLKAFSDFCKANGLTQDQGMEYLISKSGLERNIYFALRDGAKAKIVDDVKKEREQLEKDYAKGRISEADYRTKLSDLNNKEQNGFEDLIKDITDSYAYQHSKEEYDAGNISYTEYLRIKETIIRDALKRKTPKKDAEGHVVSDNYYDDYARDYSGLTETFAKEMYDNAQTIKKEAQRAIDPQEKRGLWAQYDEAMRQAYQTARQIAEDAVFVSEENREPADKLWEKINDATKETLRQSYESGLMDRNTYNKVRAMFDYYIPLRGWDEDKASDVYTYMGRDNVFSPAVKKAWGRTSKAENPLAYVGNIAVSTILAGHRNQMKQHFLNYVMNNPTSLVSISESWYENIAPEGEAPVWILRTADTAGKSPDEIATIVNDFNDEMQQKQREGKAIPVKGRLRLDVHATSGQKAEHVVEVQRAGHTYQLYINGNPKAAQALNGSAARAVSRISDTWLGKKITKINRDMAMFFTSKNPAFVVSNLSRDLNMAGASVAVNEGKRYNAQFIENVVKVLAPRLGESSKWVPASKQPTGLMPSLMRKWKNGALDERNETERYFKEFMDEGGETGFVNMLSIDSFKEKMKKEIAEMNGSALFGKGVKETTVNKGLRLLGETFEFYNRCAEDATRFIVYMTSRQMGKTLEESIADAKDVTLNFNRKGTGGLGNAEVRDLFIFVNPAIQALANMYRMAKGHPLKFGAVTAAFVAGGALMPIINQLLLNMFGDDDDKQAYWNLPPWVRKNNLVFWLPFTKNFLTIPLAQEFRVFYGVGEMMSSAIMDHPMDKWGLEVFSSVADLVPINPTGNGGNLMVDFAPTMVQPLMQVGENVDFTGKPIWRENQGNKYAPMYEKAYVTTPQWMIKMSEKVNDITGGNEGKKGVVEKYMPFWGDYINNPAVWNHLLQGYFGGMYNTIAKTFDVGVTAAKGELPKIYQTPVINRFLNRPVERDNAGVLGEEYYNLTEQRDAIQYELRTWQKKAADGDEGAQEHVDEILESPEYKRAEVVSHYEKIMKDLKAGEKAATESADKADIKQSISLYKQQMMEELDAIENGMEPLDAAVEAYNNAKTFSEKNRLRMRIERLMMRQNGEKPRTKGRAAEVDKALSYISDEEKESRDTNEKYLLQASADDVRDDARIKAAKVKVKAVNDEYKKIQAERPDRAADFYRKHEKELTAYRILDQQVRLMNQNKKLLGKGSDQNIMRIISNNRKAMLDAIKEIK